MNVENRWKNCRYLSRLFSRSSLLLCDNPYLAHFKTFMNYMNVENRWEKMALTAIPKTRSISFCLAFFFKSSLLHYDNRYLAHFKTYNNYMNVENRWKNCLTAIPIVDLFPSVSLFFQIYSLHCDNRYLAKLSYSRLPNRFHLVISLGECNTIFNAYTLYRNLG